MPPIAVLLSKLTIWSVVDILCVAVLIYNFMLMLRGRRALHVLSGLGVLALVYAAAVGLKLQLLQSVLAAIAPYTAIAIIVMFQIEIRRLLARIGSFPWVGLGRQLERREVADEIVLAVEYMAAEKTGALIVLEREIGLRTFIESGVALDALVSRDLLCSIFQPKGTLHDGAVILQGNRVAAAACFLPLSASPREAQRWGTRHLAAMGVTEDCDAIAVVVSEETGLIAVAARGELETGVPIERLRKLLIRYEAGRASRPREHAPEPQVGRAQT
jgi:diadenylate cyclase